MSADAPVTIYHNPVCGKSRGALEILRARGVDCEVVEYLQHPPDRATLERILDLLGGPPAQLVRNDSASASSACDPRTTSRERTWWSCCSAIPS